MSRSESRQRKHRVTVRLTDDEYHTLQQKSQAIDVTCAEYIRKLISRQKIVKPIMTKEDIKQILIHFKYVHALLDNIDPGLAKIDTVKEQMDKVLKILGKAVGKA